MRHTHLDTISLSHAYNLDLTCQAWIYMLCIHAHHFHAPWVGTESGWSNQRPHATADLDSVMDDNVEGPRTTKKQKIEDRGA